MKNPNYYADNWLDTTDDGIIVGGWRDQIDKNREAHYRHAMALRHKRKSLFSVGHSDLAQWLRSANGGADAYYVRTAAEAILTHIDFQLTPPTLGQKDPRRAKINLPEPRYSTTGYLLTQEVAHETRKVNRLFRGDTVVEREIPYYVVASIAQTAISPDGVGATFNEKNSLHQLPIEFAYWLEPLVYAARPELHEDGRVTIGDSEIMQVDRSWR